MVFPMSKMSGGANCAANAAPVSGGGRRRRSQRGGTTHTATAPAATAPAATAPALPAGLNMEAMKNLIGSFGSLIKPTTGGGRTRRLKRRLGKARRYSAKSHSAGGGKRRKTRRTRKHRR